MSYEICKSIVLKDKEKEVWLNSADSSVRPLSFYSWECKGLSEIYQEQGREAVFARIGKDVWDGNLQLYRGNKMCKLFLEAKAALPEGMSFMNFDGKAAGEYLAKAVMKLEENPEADLSEDVRALVALKDDRGYLLETAKRTGHSYLNEACEEVQKDRVFALEVMKACGDKAWADYPKAYVNDKEFAMEMLALNGCHYRSLSPELKADRDVILAAFEEVEGKDYHEHLPDLIPPAAYIRLVGDTRAGDAYLELDRDFLTELLEKCPGMHLERAPMLVNNKDICLKWCEVGKWFPYSVGKVPAEFLREREFQDVLVGRFEGTEMWGKLVEKFSERGVILEKPLSERLQEAVKRADGVQHEGQQERGKEGLSL